MVDYVSNRMASQHLLESMIIKLGTGSATAENLILDSSDNDAEKQKLFLSIVWMMKLGLIEMVR